jgi:hypothetical protein
VKVYGPEAIRRAIGFTDLAVTVTCVPCCWTSTT